ncbi:PIN domain-containing protein [Candidatus Venteria ishoeyi]|uniref:PIN domain-containing protein n=1 Tax=Candidatus Venteria ishoeyi TaxID=1899563 RepID=A0A1H6FFW0_9GAMM|nr:PIN domain-containing protein [Candidatus Venteria ishoeyi]SEH08960.1 Uncharacterised protein [Candidatus Venteria ishoeyi]
MSAKIFIDSNIFLYAFSDKDLHKQKIAKEIVLGTEQTISVQVVNEVSNNLLKKFCFDETMLENFISNCYDRYHVENLSKNIFILATQLRRHYLFSYYDSVIVSSALAGQCSVLYTEDMQHKQMIDGRLKIINPFII